MSLSLNLPSREDQLGEGRLFGLKDKLSLRHTHTPHLTYFELLETWPQSDAPASDSQKQARHLKDRHGITTPKITVSVQFFAVKTTAKPSFAASVDALMTVQLALAPERRLSSCVKLQAQQAVYSGVCPR